jgi:hypothetical protein
MRVAFILGLVLASTVPSAAQQAPTRLVTGKLVYVDSMPDNLDRWIMDDLRGWGKYKVTANPEGVDLVFRAEVPEESQRYTLRRGVPQPKREKERAERAIEVVDWVTTKVLWKAVILDKKPKSGEAEPPDGPQTTIFARGLKPDEIATKLMGRLRRYVEQLAPEPKPQ